MSGSGESSSSSCSINVLSLGVGQSFQGGNAAVASLDFHGQGEFLLAGAEDGTLQLINALDGRHRKTVHCRKYGIGLARFTHHEMSVLHTSKPSPKSTAPAHVAHEVRYLSLYDNAYLRFFSGHEARVSSLAMSCVDDRFLSAALDGTVRLWTLQQPTAIGVGRLPQAAVGQPALAAFDPEGLIFAVCAYVVGEEQGGDRHVIKLYDQRAFGAGAFDSKDVPDTEVQARLISDLFLDPEVAQELALAAWTDLRFSPDGRRLLVSTRASLTLVFDSADLSLERLVTGYANARGLDIGACMTPDGAFVLTGSEDGDVCVFDTSKGPAGAGGAAAPVHRLEGHSGPVRQVACNPKYELVASAGSSVVLWIPAS